MKLTEWVECRLARLAPPWMIGEIRISPGYLLTHRADAPEDPGLQLLSDWESLLELARFDAAGRFRPLRGAPGLRKGWRRGPLSIDELVADLQLLYPGAVAVWAAWEEERLVSTPFSETAGRQTGLYEGTRRLPADDLSLLVEEICTRGCLRRPLWYSFERPSGDRGEIPLLCPEVCHYFLHKARSRAAARKAA
ncbi:hypothetical protein MAMC_00466 [Methylacidimicrobium cyclopophantes]|uniref:Uncharacterized protein n=1 Tax=Methylacidimicrobium cyclopophantes TaxID=1041766 RepID=A0A5E6MA18_9BACT|nr:DR2241 family protein [Methylacidimicrobium cyclopophantes]VVM05194.1 hypothetical protein MAMC_00466 [Methylacidimicrobium cyclopophantes]